MAKGKLALKSLTNNLNSGLDNIRLESEIQTIGCREIHSSVPKKSNCVKANYLGGPALISHLKIPFVSRLVFLRLSLSNKKSIIKFKCHNIQSTDSGLGPVSTLEFCIQKNQNSIDFPLFFRKSKNGIVFFFSITWLVSKNQQR